MSAPGPPSAASSRPCGAGIAEVRVAKGFFARLAGLMLRRDLPEGIVLVIPRCAAIHTFFMRFAIDALFIDGGGRPVKFVRGIRPWRPLVSGGKKARAVVEARAGWLEEGRWTDFQRLSEAPIEALPASRA